MLAESFERIHRSNLVMMGVLPIQYQPDETGATHALDGTETFDIDLPDNLTPRQDLTVRATRGSGEVVEFSVVARVDTPIEVDYLRHGGILNFVLRQMAL